MLSAAVRTASLDELGTLQRPIVGYFRTDVHLTQWHPRDPPVSPARSRVIRTCGGQNQNLSLRGAMDDDRFDDFYSAQFADVWRFARRRTESGEDADDIVAETFVVAWRRRAHIPADGARLWLFGVARNVLANHQRETRRRGRLHLRLATENAPPAAYQDAEPDGGELWRALAVLPADDRELLLLRAWDRLGASEIATLLGISAATVSSRLHKARLRLDRELEHQQGPERIRPREEKHA